MTKRLPIFLGLMLLGIAIWLQITSISEIKHFVNRLENLVYDIQLRANLLTHRANITSPIVIVDINDASLAKQGRWPWPRSKLANLINNLQAAGAVVIAFDVIFPQAEENIANQVFRTTSELKLITPDIETFLHKIEPIFNNDQKFADSLAKLDTELGITFTYTPGIQGAVPTPLLQLKTPSEKELNFIQLPGILTNIPQLQTAAKNTGFINAFADEDGVLRRQPLLLRYQDNVYPSLAFEAARLFLLAQIKLVTASYGKKIKLEGILVNDYPIPVDEFAQVIIPFRGKSFSFPYISASDVIDNHFSAEAVQGKMVFVGATASAMGDVRPTSIEPMFPGIEVQASIADGIISHHFAYKPAWSLGAEIFITIFTGGLAVFIFPYLGAIWLSCLILLMPVLFIFGNNYLLNSTGLILSIFIPLSLTILLAIFNLIYGYLFETRRRNQLKNIFQQYVPINHIDRMLKTRGSEFGLFGEERDMTVMFSDIRGFTSISESITAAQVKELLNDFLTPMTEIIFKYRGTVDKYIGDAIVAFWGAPLEDKNHAEHAIEAVIEMQRALVKLNPLLIQKNFPEVKIGIGLNSGIMSVGDMGSKFRRNYTVLGDEVNLASRVESLTKHYGVGTIITDHTRANQENFIYRKLDRIRVVGKKASIEIYEPLCRVIEESSELKEELVLFHKALNHYFIREWKEARTILNDLYHAHPTTKLYKIYLNRIEEFENKPPPDDWDGVFTFTVK